MAVAVTEVAQILAGPDVDAFLGGVGLGLGALLLTLASWGALQIVRRILGA